MTTAAFIFGPAVATTKFQVQNYISLWRINRTDGVSEYYTSHDEDLTVPILDSVSTGGAVSGLDPSSVFFKATFLATTGLTLSASRRETGLRSENMTASGVIGVLDLTKLEGGRYDMAEVTEWLVDSRWPFMPWFQRNTYWVTNTKYSQDRFEFELEGLGRRARELHGHPFGRTCRWSLGRDDKGNINAGCGQDRSGSGGIHLQISNYTYTGCTVSHVALDGTSSDRAAFNITLGTSTPPIPFGGAYKYGRVTWTSGNNSGLTYDIGDYDPGTRFDTFTTGQFSTSVLMENAVVVGDQCTIEAGCDGTWYTCLNVYTNTENFGGWHLIPGPTRAGQPPRLKWT